MHSTGPFVGRFSGETSRCRFSIGQRNAIAKLPNSSEFDYLKVEVSKVLLDRLDVPSSLLTTFKAQDIKSDRSFRTVLDLGSGPGYNLERLQGRGIETLYQTDMSYDLLTRDIHKDENYQLKPIRICASEEYMPFAHASMDLIISNLSLHWVNDLPGTLEQIRCVLKDDGMFLAAMFGEGTLVELRNAFILAEQERDGGISNHISPFAGVNDMGNLLTAAGFNLTTIDQEIYKVDYADPFVLMHDIRCMGESNAAVQRRGFVSRDTLTAAASIYHAMYANPENGTIPATFQVIYMIGWAPHPDQPRAKRRGSATVSMKDIERLMSQHEENQNSENPGAG